jgi:Zn-dependent M28 family amino/carboxypeptidase
MNLFVCVLYLMLFSFSAHEKFNDSYDHIKNNLEFLASDELEGRETTKRGSKVAGQFIVNRLKQYGIKPYGDDGSYFQNFDLLNTIFLNSSALLFIKKQDSLALTFAENFIPFQTGEPVTDAEMVYMGYGISDSALDYDDYKNIDVSGKVIVCLFGTPSRKDNPEYFKQGRSWRSSSRKAKLAGEKGAAGIIIIQSEYWVKNWQRLAENYVNGSIGKIKKDDPFNAAWIDSLTAKDLFALQHLTYKQLRDTLNSGFLKPGKLLNTKATFKIEQRSQFVTARNIIGLLEGQSEPDGKITIIGAHYDHNGIRGKDIYNGADDNASGASALLEIARQLSLLKNNNKPILFCLWDAEEKGLLGSEFFADNYTDRTNIQAYINMDMVGREHPDSIFTFGAKFYSAEFHNIIEQINSQLSTFILDYSFDDVNHSERPYQRSDQWNFAKYKIPFAAFSDKHNAKKENDYHKPSDTADKIEYQKVIKVSRLITSIALKLANLEHNLQVDTTPDIGEK